MAFVDQYVAEFVSLEVKLLNARERLRASTDDEALHELTPKTSSSFDLEFSLSALLASRAA